MAKGSSITRVVSEAPVATVTDEATSLLSMLERAARDPAVSIEKLERLMEMKERLEARAAARAFEAAMASAKGDIPPIIKNKTVDFASAKGRTNYRHEDLAEIARVVDPILQKHGLSYRHRSSQDGNKLTVTCIMSHAFGHTEQTSLTTTEDHTGNKNSIQAIGSAATYLQRYTLKLALGLATTTDDDGKAAGAAETISEEQQAAIRDALDEHGKELSAFCEYFKIDALPELQAAQFDRAMQAIRGKRK